MFNDNTFYVVLVKDYMHSLPFRYPVLHAWPFGKGVSAEIAWEPEYTPRHSEGTGLCSEKEVKSGPS
jgi:hypothetical protein